MTERHREIIEKLEKAVSGEVPLAPRDMLDFAESVEFAPEWDPGEYSYIAVLLDSLGLRAPADTLLRRADDRATSEGRSGGSASLRNMRGMLSAGNGNFARAIDLFETALTVVDHDAPLRASILANLAAANFHADRITQAADWLQEAKNSPAQARSPAVDALLATVQAGIAQTEGNLRDLRAASSDLRGASQSRVAELGSDHPSALAAVANMATIEFNLACAEGSAEARERAIGVLDLATRRLAAELGVDHPETLVCRVNLGIAELEMASIYNSAQRFETALCDLETIAARSTSVLGIDHRVTKLASEAVDSAKTATGQVTATVPLRIKSPALVLIGSPGSAGVSAPDPSHVLTWRRRQLQVMRESVQQRGYPPSMREIGEAVGLTSTSSLRYSALLDS